MNALMEIRVLDEISNTYSFGEGLKLFNMISEHLNRMNKVLLDFTGIDALPSSFLNGFIGEAIDNFGIETVRSVLKFKGLTVWQAGQIKAYVESFPQLSHA